MTSDDSQVNVRVNPIGMFCCEQGSSDVINSQTQIKILEIESVVFRWNCVKL